MTENPNNKNGSLNEDDEVFAELDEFIKELRKKEAERKDGVEVEALNFKKVADLRRVYHLMECMTEGTDAKVTYGIHEPWIGHGYVTVVGRDLMIDEPGLIAEAAKYAENCDIFSRTDGRIQIDFAFQGLIDTLIEK